MKKILFAIAILTFGLVACHKHSDTDTVAPIINITAPTAAASFKSGSEVKITAKATDETSMHEVTLIITQDSDNKELLNKIIDVHDLLTKDIAETWTPTGFTADTNVTLTMTVVDHNDNKNVKTVKFKVTK